MTVREFCGKVFRTGDVKMEKYPISETLKRAADLLELNVDPMNSGFLAHAQLTEELAKRVLALAAYIKTMEQRPPLSTNAE